MSSIIRRLAEIKGNVLTELNGLRGQKFGMLVAASVVATSVIVAVAITGTSGSSALAGLLEKGLGAAGVAPATTATTEAPAADEAGLTSLPPPAEDKTVTTTTQPPPTDTAPTDTDSTPTDTEEPTEEPDPEPDPDPEPEPEPGRIEHVFVINLSSPGYDQSFGDESAMPYLSETLRPQGDLLPNYTLLEEDAMANNVAFISGQKPNPLTRAGCASYKQFSTKNADPKGFDDAGQVPGPGCVYPPDALTIADQLTVNSLIWHGYIEDMADQFGPGTCVHPDLNEITTPETGGYRVQRNPFIYFRSLLDLGDCAMNDVTFDQLKKDIKKPDTTPAYSIISPNLCHSGIPDQCPEGDPDGPAAADAFLEEQVPQILKSAAYKKAGLVIITFSDVTAPEGTEDPKRVGALLLSPFVSTNMTDNTRLDPYSMLRTTSELFGLDPLGEAGAKKTKSLSAQLLGNIGDS